MGSRFPIASNAIVGIDTNPFIYLFEDEGARGQLAADLFIHLRSASKITSIITPLEILTYCRRKNMDALGAVYRRYFKDTPKLAVLPVEWAVAERAVELRADYGLTTPDAVQVATAISFRAEAFITNDRRLRKVTELKILILDDFLR